MSVTRRKLYERDAAQRRANTQRVIKRRMDIVHNVWREDIFYFNRDTNTEIRYEDQPNRLSKWNLTCDCPLHKLSNESNRKEYQKRQQARVDNEYNDWVYDAWTEEVDPHLCENIYTETMYGDPEWEQELGLSD